MSRIALSSVERAQREVLPLDLALYHAARDYPGGAAAIAATTGRNATTLQHKLSPTHPSHTVNIQEFGEILELTKDRRILDAVHALVGDTTWQELAEAYTKGAAEAAAKARLSAFNRSTADVRLEMPGRTDIFAERPIIAQGFKVGLDGEYLADSVEQVFTQSGWSTTVECNAGKAGKSKGKKKKEAKPPLKVVNIEKQ